MAADECQFLHSVIGDVWRGERNNTLFAEAGAVNEDFPVYGLRGIINGKAILHGLLGPSRRCCCTGGFTRGFCGLIKGWFWASAIPDGPNINTISETAKHVTVNRK